MHAHAPADMPWAIMADGNAIGGKYFQINVKCDKKHFSPIPKE